jgi:hypothetical protein
LAHRKACKATRLWISTSIFHRASSHKSLSAVDTRGPPLGLLRIDPAQGFEQNLRVLPEQGVPENGENAIFAIAALDFGGGSIRPALLALVDFF